MEHCLAAGGERHWRRRKGSPCRRQPCPPRFHRAPSPRREATALPPPRDAFARLGIEISERRAAYYAFPYSRRLRAVRDTWSPVTRDLIRSLTLPYLIGR